MNRKLTFTVTVEFEDSIYDDNEVIQVARNIAYAIEQEADRGIGIAPESSETFTKSVEVKPEFIDEVIVKNIT